MESIRKHRQEVRCDLLLGLLLAGSTGVQAVAYACRPALFLAGLIRLCIAEDVCGIAPALIHPPHVHTARPGATPENTSSSGLAGPRARTR